MYCISKVQLSSIKSWYHFKRSCSRERGKKNPQVQFSKIQHNSVNRQDTEKLIIMHEREKQGNFVAFPFIVLSLSQENRCYACLKKKKKPTIYTSTIWCSSCFHQILSLDFCTSGFLNADSIILYPVNCMTSPEGIDIAKDGFPCKKVDKVFYQNLKQI